MSELVIAREAQGMMSADALLGLRLGAVELEVSGSEMGLLDLPLLAGSTPWIVSGACSLHAATPYLRGDAVAGKLEILWRLSDAGEIELAMRPQGEVQAGAALLDIPLGRVAEELGLVARAAAAAGERLLLGSHEQVERMCAAGIPSGLYVLELGLFEQRGQAQLEVLTVTTKGEERSESSSARWVEHAGHVWSYWLLRRGRELFLRSLPVWVEDEGGSVWMMVAKHYPVEGEPEESWAWVSVPLPPTEDNLDAGLGAPSSLLAAAAPLGLFEADAAEAARLREAWMLAQRDEAAALYALGLGSAQGLAAADVLGRGVMALHGGGRKQARAGVELCWAWGNSVTASGLGVRYAVWEGLGLDAGRGWLRCDWSGGLLPARFFEADNVVAKLTVDVTIEGEAEDEPPLPPPVMPDEHVDKREPVPVGGHCGELFEYEADGDARQPLRMSGGRDLRALLAEGKGLEAAAVSWQWRIVATDWTRSPVIRLSLQMMASGSDSGYQYGGLEYACVVSSLAVVEELTNGARLRLDLQASAGAQAQEVSCSLADSWGGEEYVSEVLINAARSGRLRSGEVVEAAGALRKAQISKERVNVGESWSMSWVEISFREVSQGQLVRVLTEQRGFYYSRAEAQAAADALLARGVQLHGAPKVRQLGSPDYYMLTRINLWIDLDALAEATCQAHVFAANVANTLHVDAWSGSFALDATASIAVS